MSATRKSIFVLLIISALFSSAISAVAHEIDPNVPIQFEWYSVGYNSGYEHNVVYLFTNGDYLNSTYSGKYTQSLNNWLNNSNNWIWPIDDDFSSSEVDLYTHATWPIEWGSSTAGVTFLYDQYGNVFPTDGVFASNGLVYYSQVAMNPSPGGNTPNSTLVEAVLVHELGHVLGLGHAIGFSGNSIMQVSFSSTPSFTIPQAHDRSDIVSKYQ